MKRQRVGIVDLTREIQDIAIGINDEQRRTQLVAKAKKIEQMASRPSIRGKTVEVDMYCEVCDLKMGEESARGKYRVLACPGCRNRVRVVWAVASKVRPEIEEPLETVPD